MIFCLAPSFLTWKKKALVNKSRDNDVTQVKVKSTV